MKPILFTIIAVSVWLLSVGFFLVQASALAKPKSPAKWKIRIFYGAVFKAVIRIDKLSLNRCAIGRKC